MADEKDEGIGQGVERARSAIARIGDLSYADLLAQLGAPPQQPPAPAKAPKTTAITEAQQKALDRLADVYGKVVPTERRTLTEEEVHALIDERLVLDLVVAMAATRKEAIRTTVFNHLDVEYEEAPDFDAGTFRDAKGHWVREGAISDPPLGKALTRETSKSTVTLNPDDLLALTKDEDAKAKIRVAFGDPEWDFTHADYLAMTEQVRAFRSEKAMLAMRKKPGLVAAIGHVTKTGAPTGSLNVRAAKAT